MILFQAIPPPVHIVRFWEQAIPGFWLKWISAADHALRQIDDDAGGDTIITSWFRSPAENARVGGNPDSQHLVGLALDVVPGKPSFKLAISEASNRFMEAGFVTVPAERHLHIQTFPAGVLRSVGVLDVLNV